MMPEGSSLRISSSVVVHGSTEEKTCCSRMRRAISWVYWPPKSRTTTPPSSELGRWWCCCIWTVVDIVPLCCFVAYVSGSKAAALRSSGYTRPPHSKNTDLDFRPCRDGAQQCCAPTLLLNSLICRGLLFALLRVCRRCVGLRLAPLMPLGPGRLRLGRRLLLTWRGRVRLLALLFRLLRHGLVRDQSWAKQPSRGLLCGRASPRVLRRDAGSWALASAQGFRECAWRFRDECPLRGAPFQEVHAFRCKNP